MKYANHLISAAVAAMVSFGTTSLMQRPIEWHLTSQQKEQLRKATEGDPVRFTIVVVPGHPASIVFAYELFSAFYKWPVVVRPYDAEHGPTAVGVGIASNDSKDALRLKSVIEGAGIRVSHTSDRRLKEGQIALIIGRRP